MYSWPSDNNCDAYILCTHIGLSCFCTLYMKIERNNFSKWPLGYRGFISKFGLLLIREGAGRQFSEGGRTVRNRMILSTTPPLKFKPSWKHCFKGALCFWLLLANTDCAFEQGWGISFTSKRTTIGFRKFRGKYLFYSWGIKIHLVSLKILSALTL